MKQTIWIGKNGEIIFFLPNLTRNNFVDELQRTI